MQFRPVSKRHFFFYWEFFFRKPGSVSRLNRWRDGGQLVDGGNVVLLAEQNIFLRQNFVSCWPTGSHAMAFHYHWFPRLSRSPSINVMRPPEVSYNFCFCFARLSMPSICKNVWKSGRELYASCLLFTAHFQILPFVQHDGSFVSKQFQEKKNNILGSKRTSRKLSDLVIHEYFLKNIFAILLFPIIPEPQDWTISFGFLKTGPFNFWPKKTSTEKPSNFLNTNRIFP